MPVAASVSDKFNDMGTGTKNQSKESNTEAIDLGDGIVYLPTVWKNGESSPIGNPIIVSSNAIKEINTDINHCEKAVLRRKYPLNTRIIDFARLMMMGVFEGANQADFSDAEEIYRITETPQSQMQRVNISTNKSYRYIRYTRPGGTFSIAEFDLYSPDGQPLPFLPIACEAILADSAMTNVFDKKLVTYYQTSGGIDMWVGADMRKPAKIGAIGYAPRNDDNAVVAADRYELFYWKDKWVSLGEKIANSDSLVYNNVPKNALLWLRNLSKGHEERPFTYEGGKQTWW